MKRNIKNDENKNEKTVKIKMKNKCETIMKINYDDE